MFEVKKLFAQELITGLARIDGRAGGHRRQPAQVQGRRALRRLGRQGRALHLAVRRLQHPAALPGRRAGLHDRHQGRARGHHPRRREDDLRRVRGDACRSICVVVRKAYGAGLYAMCGPGFGPDAMPGAAPGDDRRHGPEAAVNAVYFNKIQEKPEAERAAYVQKLRDEYRADVDIYKLASELVIDEVVPGDEPAGRAGAALRGLLPALPASRRRRSTACCPV